MRKVSLQRLGTDRLDLYLLHWRGDVPIGETVEAMERLLAAGKICHWAVSNLDRDDMEELMTARGHRLRDRPDPLQSDPARARA